MSIFDGIKQFTVEDLKGRLMVDFIETQSGSLGEIFRGEPLGDEEAELFLGVFGKKMPRLLELDNEALLEEYEMLHRIIPHNYNWGKPEHQAEWLTYLKVIQQVLIYRKTAVTGGDPVVKKRRAVLERRGFLLLKPATRP